MNSIFFQNCVYYIQNSSHVILTANCSRRAPPPCSRRAPLSVVFEFVKQTSSLQLFLHVCTNAVTPQLIENVIISKF